MIRNHIKLFFSFLNMRREKQKALVRNQSFDDLLNLAKADTMASLSSSGKPDLSRYTQIVKLTDELKEEDKNRPKEIINGREIIETIKERKPKFDHQKHGKYIGALKKKINTLYDRGELDSKDAAKKYLINLISR
jgi:hypothetical protein